MFGINGNAVDRVIQSSLSSYPRILTQFGEVVQNVLDVSLLSCSGEPVAVQ